MIPPINNLVNVTTINHTYTNVTVKPCQFDKDTTILTYSNGDIIGIPTDDIFYISPADHKNNTV